MMLKLYSWSQLNIISILIIWASTFFLSVPCHSKLQQSKDKQQISRLVLTNWPRTILWSARSLFFIWFLLKL